MLSMFLSYGKGSNIKKTFKNNQTIIPYKYEFFMSIE